jgi:hypothetical protein
VEVDVKFARLSIALSQPDSPFPKAVLDVGENIIAWAPVSNAQEIFRTGGYGGSAISYAVRRIILSWIA